MFSLNVLVVVGFVNIKLLFEKNLRKRSFQASNFTTKTADSYRLNGRLEYVLRINAIFSRDVS